MNGRGWLKGKKNVLNLEGGICTCVSKHIIQGGRELRAFGSGSRTEMQWPGRVRIGKVRCKRGHFKCLKKDGDWNTTGAIFTDDNRKGEQHADNHELWCAIQDEGIHCLKELRKHFPNQMARSENLARKLINDITPMRPPESVDSEFLWQKELRCELAQPDNGREIMTIHSGQTHQGKSVMMDHLDCECA